MIIWKALESKLQPTLGKHSSFALWHQNTHPLTVLYAFSQVRPRKMCKSFLNWWPFPFFSWPWCAQIKGTFCKKKLNAFFWGSGPAILVPCFFFNFFRVNNWWTISAFSTKVMVRINGVDIKKQTEINISWV